MQQGIIVDNFAGGGGASTGITLGLGRHPALAINHNYEALAMHAVNHPFTEHLCEDVWDVHPVTACRGRPVDLAWFSPDCKHFSKAKGGKPVDKKIRGLAWVAVKWIEALPLHQRPKVIMMENVEEFKDWGPLDENDMPIKAKMGFTYRRFVKALEKHGYKVEDRELVADQYGTPQRRKRLFLIARRDGLPIVWPAPTHGPGLIPYRVAADVIDWSLKCPSIFTRTRELAHNTQRRIARGIFKFIYENPSPYIVRIGHTGHGDSGKVRSITEPLSTITSKNEHLLCVPYMVPRYGERPARGDAPGQAPRVLTVEGPMPTIVPTANGAGLVAAFLAKHNAGNEATGQVLGRPMDTVTAIDTKALVHAHLGRGEVSPAVRAFLIKFYSEGGQWSRVDEPMHTIPTVDRMGLVTVYGEEYAIVDIGMRMLTPRELYNAQGFPGDYKIDIEVDGRRLSARSQVRMCGNSVPPPFAQALAQANFPGALEQMREAGD